MIRADFSDKHEADWFHFLAGGLTDESRADLIARVENAHDPAAPPPEGGNALDRLSARLLSFYIRRASNGNGLSSDELSKLGGALRNGEAVPAVAAAQPAEEAPAAAPEPAPAPPPQVEQELAVAGDPNLIAAIRLVYRLTVKRDMAEEEVRIWQTNMSNGLAFHDFLNLMNDSDEARARRDDAPLFPELNDADFVQNIYRHIEKRGALPQELEIFRGQLATGAVTRQNLIVNFFASALERERSGADNQVHDGLSCAIMGTTNILTLDEWKEQSKDKKALAAARRALKPKTPYTVTPRDDVLRVSAITSLFRGGDFIEQFMDNMVTQTIFDKYTELLIIDADSPENEAETIERYMKDFPNIRYQRMNSCIGIYEAWNIGAKMSRGKYLTNANLDDLRRQDSFEIQAGALDTLPFVDLVYQDFYYSFAPDLSWEQVAAYGHKSDLPVVTPYNMLRFNSPHNAPMWRRELHDELGYFDGSFKSAGDYDMWMRCMRAGKTFMKINEPHVVYYQNPKGLSTRADTRGVVEAREVLHRYAHDLISPAFTAPLPDFAEASLGVNRANAEKVQNRNKLVQNRLRSLSQDMKPKLKTETT